MGSHGALASLFSVQSHTYALFRPRYPPQLFAHVLECAQLAQRELAVDLGCGSGQATADIAPLFDRVIGLDASAEQLSHVPGPGVLPNAELRCCPTEATGLPDQCADLVTAAAALHWFDLPAAYREVRRILKPGGALAAWTYTPWSALADPEGHYHLDAPAVERLQADLLAEFWPFFHQRLQTVTLDSGYTSCLPSSEDFAEVQLDSLEMQQDMSVEQMLGWVQSWSAYEPYCRQHGQAAAQALLEQHRQDMVAALGVLEEHTPVRTLWPIHFLLARKPVPLAAGAARP